MATKKNQTSPKGLARWAHVTVPNTKFDSDGVFSIELVVSETEAEALKAQLQPMAKEYLDRLLAEEKDGKKKAKLKALAMQLPIAEDTDENGEPNGKFVIKFKSKASYTDKDDVKHEKRILLFDAKGKQVEGVRIGNGSTVKVGYYPSGWAMLATGKYGIRLDLKAVQILDLVEYSGGDASSFGFESEEGYSSESEMPNTDSTEAVGVGSDGTDGSAF